MSQPAFAWSEYRLLPLTKHVITDHVLPIWFFGDLLLPISPINIASLKSSLSSLFNILASVSQYFVFTESWQCEIARKSHQQPVCGIMFSYRGEYVCTARGKIVLVFTFWSYFLHFQGFYSEFTTSVGTWVGNSMQLAVDSNSKYAQFAAAKSVLCYYTNYRMLLTFMFSIWISFYWISRKKLILEFMSRRLIPWKDVFSFFTETILLSRRENFKSFYYLFIFINKKSP